MGNARHFLSVVLCLVLFSGCAGSGWPEVTSSFSQDNRNSPWPGFLPVDTILAGDLVDFEQAQNETNALRARAFQLRKKARMLRGPVLKIQERLKMQQAVLERS